MSVVIPPIVSVDDHVVEPPDLWLRWLPEKFRDLGPRVVPLSWEYGPGLKQPFRPAASGPETDFWVYGDIVQGITTGMASAGLPGERIDSSPIRFGDMRPGCYDGKARVEDNTLNGVERCVCFPTFPRFAGQIFLWGKDKVVDLACVKAYNDWMIEEWCGDSAGRLIPLCIVPLWDPVAAADEVQRNAARGARAVAFTELPASLDLPSIHDADGYWEPFFRACSETSTALCIHIGSSSTMANSSADAPLGVRIAGSALNPQLSLIDWLLSGQLVTHPNLKIAYSECQIGWMPYILERVDSIWRRGYKLSEIPAIITEPPSSYLAGRVYGCFFEDDFGLLSRYSIGVGQITFESDYPHQDSTWPNTKSYAEVAMADLLADEIDRICRGNAIELFDLPRQLS
jgi:predicted TIM-barrel fold metal-dependent hydrolase